jgi:shikimate kinase
MKRSTIFTGGGKLLHSYYFTRIMYSIIVYLKQFIEVIDIYVKQIIKRPNTTNLDERIQLLEAAPFWASLLFW